MSQPRFQLSTDFSLPSGLPTARSEVRDVTIMTTSLCLGRATRVCGEIETALLNGAVPDAQLVMAHRVGEARQKGIPLTCVLSMGS
jgi:hypothetical protein